MSYHPAKFGDHRRGSTGDTIILTCHVIFKDQLFKVSCDFIGEKSSL